MKVNLNTNQLNCNSYFKNPPINSTKCAYTPQAHFLSYTNKKTVSFNGTFENIKNEIISKSKKIAFFMFLNRKAKVTKEEFEYIKKNCPYIIDMANKYSYEEYISFATVEDMARIAIKTDEYLKENCDNYRIISIGTSPAALTLQLSNMGHEVIFLPISGLRDFDEKNNYLENIEDYKELKTALDYLKSKNIDDGKQNIILDYTNSGMTLSAVTYLIKRYCGLKIGKVKKLPLSTLLDNAFLNPTREEKLAKESYLDDMKFNNVAQVSPVPHFPVLPNAILDYKCYDDSIEVKNMPKEMVYRKFDEFSKPLARAYALSVMNEIDKIKSDFHQN